MSKLIVFGNRVKPNRYYQIVKVLNGGISTRKEEAIGIVMKGEDLFREYGSIMEQKRHEVQRRKKPIETTS